MVYYYDTMVGKLHRHEDGNLQNVHCALEMIRYIRQMKVLKIQSTNDSLKNE